MPAGLTRSQPRTWSATARNRLSLILDSLIGLVTGQQVVFDAVVLGEHFLDSPGEAEHPPFDFLQQRPSPVRRSERKSGCGFRALEPLVELDLVGKSL